MRRSKDGADRHDAGTKAPDESPKPRRQTRGFFSFDFFFLLSATVAVVFAVRYLDLLDPSQTKRFTKTELATFDGEDGAPLYLAILGEVYDVSKGAKYYGKGSGYHCFVGKDATRSFVTGEFVKDLTDEIDDFTAEKHGGLADWRQFFRDHSDYVFKGKLIGAFYDEKGQATEALKKAITGALQAEEIKAQQEAAKKANPNCNSKWAQGKGGEVWCAKGYPRIVVEYFPGAEPKKRCACFEEMDLSHQQQLYDNCPPDATRCVVPPKPSD